MTVVLAVALPARAVSGQEPGQIPISPSERLRVFLDCQSPGCDFDFFRSQITYLDWVRDREDAQVHVLVTSEATGGGGHRIHLAYVGRGDYAGASFQHDFDTPDWYSTDELRRAVARRLQAGFLPFLAGREEFDWIEVRFTSPESVFMFEPPKAEDHDPWHGWVFSVGVSGSYGGETQTRTSSYSGSFSAGRTTEASRVRLSVSGSESRDEFDFGDETFTSSSEKFQTSLALVRSVAEHWGVGLRGALGSSTYENMDREIRVGLAAEANLFPYSEVTRRALIVQYSLGWNSFDYEEITLFDKEKERVFDHQAVASLNLLQEWGEVNVEAGGSQYLHDPKKYGLMLSGTFSIRLFRGFSLDLWGSYDSVHNQLNIPKGGASEQEVLLRRKALETSYYAYASVGFSYRFGSILNNAVNPRLGSFR